MYSSGYQDKITTSIGIKYPILCLLVSLRVVISLRAHNYPKASKFPTSRVQNRLKQIVDH